MKVRLKSVDEHLREKCKDPGFRGMLQLEEEKAKIASLIVRYRADHHMNQVQLARKVGVTQQYISKIEEGDFSNLSTVWRILRALGYRIFLRVSPLGRRGERVFQRAA
jgi:DNA-binding XRE family transcriptional regulator